MIVPDGYDPERLEQYHRRIDRFQERQAAARARNIEAQRRVRIFISVAAVVLVLTGATSAYVAYSLRQLKGIVDSQLQAAQTALTASNERWKDARQALDENRTALQASEEILSKLRVEARAGLLLPEVDRYIEQLRAAGRDGLQDDAATRLITARLKQAVQPVIVRELLRSPDTSDAQLIAVIQETVNARLRAVVRATRERAGK